MSRKLKRYQQQGEVKLTLKQWCSQNGDICTSDPQRATQLYDKYSSMYDMSKMDIGFNTSGNMDISFSGATDTSPEAEEAQYNAGPQLNPDNLRQMQYLNQDHLMLPAYGQSPLPHLAAGLYNAFHDIKDIFTEPSEQQTMGYQTGEFVIDPQLQAKHPNNPKKFLVPRKEYLNKYYQNWFDQRTEMYPDKFASVDFDLDEWNETGKLTYIGDPLEGDLYEIENPDADVITWDKNEEGNLDDISSWGEYDNEGELITTPIVTDVEEVDVEEVNTETDDTPIVIPDDVENYEPEFIEEEEDEVEILDVNQAGKETKESPDPTGTTQGEEFQEVVPDPFEDPEYRENYLNKLKRWNENAPDDYYDPNVVIHDTEGRSYYEPYYETVNLYQNDIDRVGYDNLMSHELHHHMQNMNNELTYHQMMKKFFPNDGGLHFETYVPKPKGPVTHQVLGNYYDRRPAEKNMLMNSFMESNPDARFFPAVQEVAYNRLEDQQYDIPWTMEGEAYEVETEGGYPENILNRLRENAELRTYQDGGDDGGGDDDGWDAGEDDGGDWDIDEGSYDPDIYTFNPELDDQIDADDNDSYQWTDESYDEEDDEEYTPQSVDPPEEYDPQTQDYDPPDPYDPPGDDGDDEEDGPYDPPGGGGDEPIADGGGGQQPQSGGRGRQGGWSPYKKGKKFLDRDIPKAFWKLSHAAVSIAKPLNMYLSQRQQRKRQEQLKMSYMADNMFAATEADLSGSKGDYTTNEGFFRPNDRTLSRMGKYGMEMKHGGSNDYNGLQSFIPKASDGMEYYKNNYPGYEDLNDNQRRQLDYEMKGTTYNFYEDLYRFQNPNTRNETTNTMSYPFPEFMREYDNHPGRDAKGTDWSGKFKNWDENPNMNNYYKHRWSKYGDWDSNKGWGNSENRKQGVWTGLGTTVTNPDTGKETNWRKGPWEGFYSGYSWMPEDPISVSEKDWNTLVEVGAYNPKYIDERGRWSRAKNDYVNRDADAYMAWENILRKNNPELTTMQIHDLMHSGVHRQSMRGGRKGSPWAPGIPTPGRMNAPDYKWGEYGDVLFENRQVMPPSSREETNYEGTVPAPPPIEYPDDPEFDPITFDEIEDPFTEYDDELTEIPGEAEMEEEIELYDFDNDGVNDDFTNNADITTIDPDTGGMIPPPSNMEDEFTRSTDGGYDPSSRNDYDYTPQTTRSNEEMNQSAYGNSGSPQTQDYEPQATSGTNEYIPQTVAGTDDYEPQTQQSDEDDSTDAKFGGQFFNNGGEAEIDINMYKQLIAAGADIEIL